MDDTKPYLKLRWLVTESQEAYNSSWVSYDKPVMLKKKSEAVLQYSLDGVTWLPVETVIEFKP